VIELLDDGGLCVHCALSQRGNRQLDEVQILDISEKLAYFRDLASGAKRSSLHRGAGKLTDELKARIEATLDKNELEDLYLPYKPKRRTKATLRARRGLSRCAVSLAQQNTADSS